MFSRYGHVPAAAVMLMCLSVLILSAVSLSETSYARNPVTPTLQTGDPDEFETGVGESAPFGGMKAPMSADASMDRGGPAALEAPGEEEGAAGDASAFWNSALRRALRRFVLFVMVELDVM